MEGLVSIRAVCLQLRCRRSSCCSEVCYGLVGIANFYTTSAPYLYPFVYFHLNRKFLPLITLKWRREQGSFFEKVKQLLHAMDSSQNLDE